MATLEKRFYPREEIAQIVGIADLHDKHFAEKVKRYLDNLLYGYDYSRKGVIITELPQTAEAQLANLLRETIGLDVQIDAFNFACFIRAFSVIGSFTSMPWTSRTAFFNQHYENEVSQATLQRWMKRMVDSDNIIRFKKGALWRTLKDEDGDKVQVRVDPDSEEYREYSRLKEVAYEQLGAVYLNVLQMKIEEMKDTASNRDVNSGSAGSGVTAAAAIAALQEAGNKTSRDMSSARYRA